MIDSDGLRSAADDAQRVVAITAEFPNAAPWVIVLRSVGIDIETAAEFARAHAHREGGASSAFLHGLVLGVVAGRRDAAECMEIPA